MWHVYILKCSDDTFYTGIAKDLNQRIEEHNFSNLGAKYTRGRRPVKLVYSKKFKDRSDASREEWRIKKMKRGDKAKMLNKKR